jgi:2-iminoacetate synthase
MIKQYKIKASCKALILLGFIMVFNFNDLLSQTVTIISKSTSQPVENCYVYNNDSSKMAISNQKGEFRLDEFSDSDVLTISHVSYYNKRVSVSEIKAKKNKIVLDENLIPLQEFVLIENKRAESLKRTYNKIDIIETKEIRDISPQSSADLLRSSGKVFVQQSQLGGGSPVIRGFESNRLLIVIDGVRMNNAIYRAGHLQNVITIDPEMLERVEVLHGPGSIMYGSDAMGGVMHFFTKNPQLSNSDTTLVNGDLSLRYGSAANDYMQSFRINVGTKKFALLSGVTAKSIGDLRQGSARDEKYGDWGKRLYYVERINNIDSVITNSDPLVQKQSGYKQFDLFTKLLYKPCEKYSVLVNAQYSNTTDVPRYDRLNTFDGNIPKYAEWYYGPQKRALISVKQTLTNNYLLFDEMDVTMAYQNISEDRINRRFRKSKKRHQEETVNQYTFNTDFYKQVAAKNKINYGMEFIYNTVNSNAYHENVKTGEITKTAISRYPDKLNNMFHAAAYLSHKWDICDKFIFSQSLRYNYVTLNSEYTPEMLQLADFPITGVISQKNQTVNGALGVVYLPGRDWRLKANVSTGFRAGNKEAIRHTLSDQEIVREVEALEDNGQKRLILVYGEHPAYNAEYIAHTVRLVYSVKKGNGEIRRVNINAAPLSIEDFRTVKAAGIGTYQIFQETYHPEAYKRYHLGGKKTDYNYRLTSLDRAQEAGIDDVGIGALLGLYDWRFEVMGLVRHTNHFEACYNVGPHTISFPRLKDASSASFDKAYDVSDEDFTKLVAILRLAVPYTGLILTARENPEVRKEVMKFGVSQIDGGTKLEIGSYTESLNEEQNLNREQFHIGDSRSLNDIINELLDSGYLPSFCTACYRLGRTGEHFMEFSVPGFIKRYCSPNAILTLTEYLEDYAPEETKAKGYKVIEENLKKLEDDSYKVNVTEIRNRIEKIKKGERDLYF